MKKLINKFKRGFTIVELVVVIAVIAILAAVLIPTLVNVINQAEESNDIVLVNNLNTIVSSYGTVGEIDKVTMSDGTTTVYNVTTALTAADANGYDVSKLTPTSESGDIVYNASTNRFIYYADDFSELAYGDEPSSDDVLIVIDSNLSRVGVAEAQNLTVQYCVYSETNASISTASDITIWLYTASSTTTIDAANANVYHFGSGDYVYVSAVASSSYHLYGTFDMVYAVKGHIDTTNASLKGVFIPSASKSNITVDINVNTTIYTDDDNITFTGSTTNTDAVNVNVTADETIINGISKIAGEVNDSSIISITRTDATCEKDGQIVYTDASGNISATIILSATGHSYEVEYTNPKLTGGQITYDLVYTCTECDENTENHTKTEAGVTNGNNFGWNLGNATNVLVSYSGSLTDIVIPDGIVTISEQAFYNNSTITSVVIPDSVTEIGSKAFAYCTSLKSVTIGSGDTDLSNGSVFSQCTALETIIISEGVTSISGGSFFSGCKSISYISIPDSIEYLGYYTFENSSLDIYTNSPKVYWLSTTCIENPAPFNYNSEDKCYYIGNENNPYVVLMAVLDRTITSFTVNSGTKIIGRYAFCSKVNSSGTIDSSSSKCTNLTSITFNDGLKCIGYSALASHTKLTNIDIPDSVKLIDKYAFKNCTAITTVTIGNGVTEIGLQAFYSCKKITSLTLGNSLQTIGDSAFYQCSGYSSLVIPDSVITIGDNAFSGNSSVTSLTLGNGVQTIGSCAFQSCKMTELSIPDSVKTIGSEAFNTCTALETVIMGSGVTSIDSKVFQNCISISAITINGKITSIGEYAFDGCRALTSITIPDSVTSIGTYAFKGCTLLTSITIPNSVTSIGSYTFYGCTSLTSITIPYSVTSIGSYTFYGCTSLTSITIPNSVTSIGSSAFYGCTSLESITIPDSVTSIGKNAFNGSGVTSVTFETASGWSVSESLTGTFSPVTLTDESTNATLLKTTYGAYYWKRT